MGRGCKLIKTDNFKYFQMKVSSIAIKALLFFKERRFKKVKYLFLDKHSDILLVTFSGFTGDIRRYNYVKSFYSLHADKLFILDTWGVKGSYYLYENGENTPESLVTDLLTRFIKRKQYSKICFAGSSKGGTAAIYYGLKFSVDEVFAGACQYNLGSYLHRVDHEPIFKGMMGINAGESECAYLNSIMPSIIENNAFSKTRIHLVYSKKDLTYERQLIDLIKKCNSCHITLLQKEEDFVEHEEIGKCFPQYVISYLSR